MRAALAASALAAMMSPGAAAGQGGELVVLGPGMRLSDPGALSIESDRIDAGIAAARGPLTELSGALGRLPSRRDAALVETADGRILLLRRRGDVSTVSPLGSVTGPLPVAGAVSAPSAPGIAEVLPVRVDDDPRANTGDEVGPLDTGPLDAAASARAAIRTDARADAPALAPCGAGLRARDHCALPTVELRELDGPAFCTGVVISQTHLMTAAHCLCGRIDVDDGSLLMRLDARMGAGGVWTDLDLAMAPPALFTPILGGPCATGGSHVEALRNGDLALLRLAPGALDDARSDLAAKGVSEEARSRMIAPLAERREAIWRPSDAVPNLFATWGFGMGPDGAFGRKRALDYPLRDLGDCMLAPIGQAPAAGGPCEGLQEANFHDPGSGLCFGDSGSGLFKPVDGDAPQGLAPWALMGIVSGSSASGSCFNEATGLLATHHERNVVRIDTPLVRDWIEGVTAGAQGEVAFLPVRESVASRLAED